MLELINVSAGYGTGNVIHDINMVFPDGESWCLLGPNGCGKTTLLRCAARLLPCEGQVLIDGRDISGMKRRQLASRIALMSQVNSVYFPYTVYDTVMLGRYQHTSARLFGGASAADKEAVERCLETTGLSGLRNRLLNELSGGQLQRVFLAHTLAQEPDIILLDEPTNHLDVKHQAELTDHLHEWCSDGKRAVIGVFHDINLALRLSRKAVFMNEGRILGAGDFRDIADKDFLKDVYGMDIFGFMRESLSFWQ